MAEQKIYKLENTIQDYAWGTRNVLNQLFSIPNPANKPQAEIWMGAHPKASSTVLLDDSIRVPLIDFIRQDPVSVLGSRVKRERRGHRHFCSKPELQRPFSQARVGCCRYTFQSPQRVQGNPGDGFTF